MSKYSREDDMLYAAHRMSVSVTLVSLCVPYETTLPVVCHSVLSIVLHVSIVPACSAGCHLSSVQSLICRLQVEEIPGCSAPPERPVGQG